VDRRLIPILQNGLVVLFKEVNGDFIVTYRGREKGRVEDTEDSNYGLLKAVAIYDEVVRDQIL